jgi:hypothetical protein
VVFRIHALQRMSQRRIDQNDIRQILETGDVIEDYPDDTPYPSRLLLGWIDERPIHVVVAERGDADEAIVITVYEPDPARWAPGFRKRTTP